MQNTRISYLYRDGSNYKQSVSVTVAGRLTFDDVAPYLEIGAFCPRDVGLPHPGSAWEHFPGGDDHAWCALDPSSFEETDDPADHGTAGDLLDKFAIACARGWPDQGSEFYTE